MRKFFLCLLGLLLAMPSSAAEQLDNKATLQQLEHYLSGVQTIQAEFTQSAPDGSVSLGQFYLQRPGKLRMEYTPPTPILLVASGGDIAYYDKQLDQVSHISLDSTLVGFLAREKIAFDDSVKIVDLTKKNHSIRISLVETKHPRDGVLTLEFSDQPLLLRNMIVTDNGGQVTKVALNNARFNVALDKQLFVFKDPHLRGRNQNK